jgi:HAD superfamily hydrolase (TIGR01509 family)
MKAALLFDLDGTLVDTDHLHLASFNQVFGRHGVVLSRAEYTARVMGKPNVAIAAELVPDAPLAEAKQLLDEKEEVYRALTRALAPGALAPIAGLVPLLDWATSADIACAVVTNAPRGNAELVLNALGLAAHFKAVIIADELAEMKPHPLPYLTALERLGATAAHAVVFEDSPSGIMAGDRAGMPVFGLMTTLSAAALIDAGASLAIADYDDPRIRPFIEGRLSAPSA